MKSTKALRFAACLGESDPKRLKYALWAFEVDEKALPQNLSELLPLYLRAVPTCPYRSSALQYNPKERMLTCQTADGVLGEGFGIVEF